MQNDDYRARANFGIILGLLAQFFGSLLALQPTAGVAQHGLTLAFTGSVLLVWGCISLARLKGYAWPMGLLGLTSFIGVILLVLLPGRR